MNAFLCFVFQALIIFSDGLDESVERVKMESERLMMSGNIFGKLGQFVATVLYSILYQSIILIYTIRLALNLHCTCTNIGYMTSSSIQKIPM